MEEPETVGPDKPEGLVECPLNLIGRINGEIADGADPELMHRLLFESFKYLEVQEDEPGKEAGQMVCRAAGCEALFSVRYDPDEQKLSLRNIVGQPACQNTGSTEVAANL